MTNEERLKQIAKFAVAGREAANQGSSDALQDIFHAFDAIYLLTSKSDGFLKNNDRPFADRLAGVERWTREGSKR